jgi:hypothetical protein
MCRFLVIFLPLLLVEATSNTPRTKYEELFLDPCPFRGFALFFPFLSFLLDFASQGVSVLMAILVQETLLQLTLFWE